MLWNAVVDVVASKIWMLKREERFGRSKGI